MDIKEIYKKIAKQNGVSAEEVEREIKAAIDEAYKNPNETALDIPRKGDKPTPEEFISHIAQAARSTNNSGK